MPVLGQVVVVDLEGVILIADRLAQRAGRLLQPVVLLEGGVAALRQHGLVRLERRHLLDSSAAPCGARVRPGPE